MMFLGIDLAFWAWSSLGADAVEIWPWCSLLTVDKGVKMMKDS